MLAICKNDMVIYAPAAFLADKTSIATRDFTYDSGNMHLVTLFFEGTREEAQALVNKSTHRGLKEATLVEWTGLADSEYIPESPTAWTIVYSYNMCTHAWSTEVKVSVSDFYSPIEIGKKCTKCGKIEVENTIAPLFECIGYSASLLSDADGKYSIVIGYRINNEAIQQYVNVCDSTFEWGTVVCSPSVSGVQPLALDGEEVLACGDGVLTARQDNAEYSHIDIKVKNISKGMNGKELVVALYARDGNTIYYLTEQGQSTSADTVKIEV